jgi:predicted dehydrogenase
VRLFKSDFAGADQSENERCLQGDARAIISMMQLRTEKLAAALLAYMILTFQTVGGEEGAVGLIMLDPGHFHAALMQESMLAGVSPVVHVYAPEGPDVRDYLQRVTGFNHRSRNPTHWEEKVHAGPDFLEAMLREKAGDVVVISGNNARKMEYIKRSIEAGFNVLGDKPLAITPADFELLRKAFAQAATRKVLLYDIMTERYQVATILQRELARMPEVFGTLEKGSAAEPAVVMESVHHFLKEAAGTPVVRPGWFFDTRQEGEAIPDVGTHLVDLVQWECFPDQGLDWRKDVKVQTARRWATTLTLDQFTRVTGLERYPDFLKTDIRPDGALNVFQNGEVAYTVRGVHAKVTALWEYQAPPGAGDTHYALLRGSRASLEIRQGPEQRYHATLYVEDRAGAAAADIERRLRAALARLGDRWPGLDLKPAGGGWEVVVPESSRVAHESTFGQVIQNYLRYLAAGKLPDWEAPNMIAKYYVTTEGYRLSHGE